MKLGLRIKPYIQPFERQLALMEARALAGARVVPSGLNGDTNEFSVTTDTSAKELASRLAYWEVVRSESEYPTAQVLFEATSTVVRNGIPLDDLRRQLPFKEVPTLPNRRCLRYGTHGIHEYRGKFFPQLVRALINIGGVPAKGIVADPMCGSGTTVVEAAVAGRVGIGADINPLSVLMARTKCALLNEPPEKIRSAYDRVRSALLKGETAGTLTYFNSLPPVDQKYLRNWFSEQVLLDLDRVMRCIRKESDAVMRDFLVLALSNIIRSVSWQKLDDLRVRREPRIEEDIDPVKEFLEELGRSVRSVLALRYQTNGRPRASFEISEHSATAIPDLWRRHIGKIDAIITSPPYATALPYLDTDRLSLAYLQLLSRPLHRRRDELMIGNREVTERARRQHWENYLGMRRELPHSVVSLVDKISRLNSKADVGFRRRNLAALLARYFLDMRQVLRGCSQVLKKKGPAFVVIGNNSTTAGHKHVDIETAKLLGDLAASAGLEIHERISMEMLVSRDIFRRNAMASEVILWLKRR